MCSKRLHCPAFIAACSLPTAGNFTGEMLIQYLIAPWGEYPRHVNRREVNQGVRHPYPSSGCTAQRAWGVVAAQSIVARGKQGQAVLGL